MALLSFMPLFFADPAHASNCVSAQESQTIAAIELSTPSSEAVVRTIETCGGDDISYQVPLTTTVSFDGVEYSSVYATTNSVITFGRPDGTYWTYPNTPSISLYSMDWVVYPYSRADEHLIIQTSDGGFQIDISARPIWLQNPSIVPTNIIITAAINSDGTVAIAYSLTGPTYDDQSRTGVRLNNGSIVTLEDYGVIQVEEAPELTPEPVAPTPPPTAPFVPEGAMIIDEGSEYEVVAPEGQRISQVLGYYGDSTDVTRGFEVSDILTQLHAGNTSAVIRASNEAFSNDPAPGTYKILIFMVVYESAPVEVVPEPEQPAPAPQEPSVPQPEPPIIEPEPEPTPEEPVRPVEPIDPPVEESVQPESTEPPMSPVEPEISPEEPVQPQPTLIEGVGEALIAAGEAISETFEAAAEAVNAAVEAFQTAGLDMTQEERKTAQSVVVPSVIVAQIATLTFRK